MIARKEQRERKAEVEMEGGGRRGREKQVSKQKRVGKFKNHLKLRQSQSSRLLLKIGSCKFNLLNAL